jgi:hypothetical protein
MRPAVIGGPKGEVPARGVGLAPILAIWVGGLLLGVGFLWFEGGLGEYFSSLYLLPWSVMAGIVVLAPSIYLYYTGKFDLFNPLVFATWSYVFPALIIGSVIVAFRLIDPYFMPFIGDPEYNLPLSLVYIAIGFAGLSLGYFLPLGRKIAERTEGYLPKMDWRPEQVWAAGVVLLIIGVGFNILGFLQGLLGYQRNIDVDVFDGLLSFLLNILTAGTVLLWLAIFSTKQKTGAFYLILAVLILFFPIRMAVLGSRSSLLIGLLPVIFTFYHSGRRIKWQHTAIFGTLAVIAMLVGIVYGTQFRNIRGSEERVEAGDYFGQVLATIEHLGDSDPGTIVADGAHALASRVENFSSLAVVVANYEQLAPYEASYGLQDNIVNDLYSSFIPRFVWPDKPSTSDPRAYSDLYFNFGDNSFAITPFGDLLRNFGPIGILIGMLILGIYLRFLYAALIDTNSPALWKKVAYFLLLTVVSYEAFYATIFPTTIRTMFVLGISFAVTHLVVVITNTGLFNPASGSRALTR